MLRREPGDEAVDGERRQRPRLEEAHQEAHREVGGDRRAERARRAPGRGRRRPAWPKSSGSLSTAAAPMIGVASRNANRAASLLREADEEAAAHRRAGAREAGDQRERLGGADEERARASRPAARSARRRRRRSAARAGAAARRRRAAGRSASGRRPPTWADAKTLPQLVLRAASPRIPAGIVPTTSSQPSFASASSGVDAAVAQRAAEPLHDPHPVAPEEPEQHERRREVGRDEEGEEVLVVLVDVPAEQLRQDHAVPEARDREELGDALQEPRGRSPAGRRSARRGSRRAGRAASGRVRNQAKTRQASPTRNAAIPCFTWWWLEPAWWPGKKPGSDFAGSRPVDDRDRDQDDPGDDGERDEQAVVPHRRGA